MILFNFVQPMILFSPCFSHQWDLICDRKHLKAMTQSVYMAGLLVGSVALGSLSDHFGRKVGVFYKHFRLGEYQLAFCADAVRIFQ